MAELETSGNSDGRYDITDSLGRSGIMRLVLCILC